MDPIYRVYQNYELILLYVTHLCLNLRIVRGYCSNERMNFGEDCIDRFRSCTTLKVGERVSRRGIRNSVILRIDIAKSR
jgi:hypothetical protein